MLDELERLILQINRTNSATSMPDGRTVSAALAERDVLRRRYSLVTGAAHAASGSGPRGVMMRSTRSELKVVTDLDVRACGSRPLIWPGPPGNWTPRSNRSTGQRTSSSNDVAVEESVGSWRGEFQPAWWSSQDRPERALAAPGRRHRVQFPKLTVQAQQRAQLTEHLGPGITRNSSKRPEGGQGDSHKDAAVGSGSFDERFVGARILRTVMVVAARHA